MGIGRCCCGVVGCVLVVLVGVGGWFVFVVGSGCGICCGCCV